MAITYEKLKIVKDYKAGDGTILKAGTEVSGYLRLRKWAIKYKDETYMSVPREYAVQKEKPILVPQPVKKVVPVIRYPDNGNSNIPTKQLDAFVEKLVKLDLGFPLFTVSDCNTFHTSGHLWGAYAVRQLEEICQPDGLDGAIAVINIDQHADAGGYGSEWASSKAWGGSLLEYIKNRKHNACFLTLYNGVKGGTPGGRLSYVWKSKIHENLASTDIENVLKAKPVDYNKLLDKVATSIGEGKKVKYLFIGVDRDCLTQSYTYWGEGLIPNKDLSKVIVGLVDAFKLKYGNDIRVIGVDICGLPEHPSRLERCSTRDGKTKDVYAKLNTELVQLWYYARSLPTIIRKKSMSVRKGSMKLISPGWRRAIFYSGSVSYTYVKPKESSLTEEIQKTQEYMERLQNTKFGTGVGYSDFHAPDFIHHTYNNILIFKKTDPPWQYVISGASAKWLMESGRRPFYLARRALSGKKGIFFGGIEYIGALSCTRSSASASQLPTFKGEVLKRDQFKDQFLNNKGLFSQPQACGCERCLKMTATWQEMAKLYKQVTGQNLPVKPLTKEEISEIYDI